LVCLSFLFISHNVLRLQEVGDFGAQNCLPALNLIRSTKPLVTTEPPISCRCCYVPVLFSQCLTHFVLIISPWSGTHLSYSISSAIFFAKSIPFILATKCNAPSIPADIPAVVITFPLST